MTDEIWRRHQEEAERLRRLLDPYPILKSVEDPLTRHFEEERRLARALEPRVELRANDHLSELAAAIQDPLADMREQLTSLTLPREQMFEQMNMASQSVAKQIQSWLEPLVEARSVAQAWLIEEQARIRRWSTVFDDLAKMLRLWPTELARQLTVLLAKGWCLDPAWTPNVASSLADAFQEGEEEAAQQWLMDHFTARLDEIEATVVERHPKRSTIIGEAFKAHREGRYHLSIPPILSQAEGVILDRHEQKLFSTVAKLNLKTVLDKLSPDSIGAVFINVFYEGNPLIDRTDSLPPGFDGLNRHAVLHGSDTGYGTQVNALRAVSLLNLASHLTVEEPDESANGSWRSVDPPGSESSHDF